MIRSQISKAIQSIELNRLLQAVYQCPMQLAAFAIEASRFGGGPRHDHPHRQSRVAALK
jgi:hypothetical protein